MVKQIHMAWFDFHNFPESINFQMFSIFMSRRDDSRCKICKENEGEDWLGCDACDRYLHASCLNVYYGETLQDMFYCP